MKTKTRRTTKKTALDATYPHTTRYWELARSGMQPSANDHPLPDPGDPEHHDGGYRWVVDDISIITASFQIATLLFGPDNGCCDRDDIECQMQKVMKTSFDWKKIPESTCGTGSHSGTRIAALKLRNFFRRLLFYYGNHEIS